MTLTIRLADKMVDRAGIWRILEPVIRAGETYPLPRDMTDKAALTYWLSSLHTSFVCEDDDGTITGTYYIRPNNSGGGAHIANCGYMVAADAEGKGIATAMCAHSLKTAREMGFAGMQFNFVIASNTRAVALWTRMGFETIGRLPGVFRSPTRGEVDALVMFQRL
ncbi:MAG: GNAT family N-acetyltransferase [Alphaproteobacteria bacterium]|nr:GNAT family N-acetyltransferase [Alphaproteobacteria bacterium]